MVQGQQKSFLVALKLAQYDLVMTHSNRQPILLLDDIFDKLDMQRVEQLIGMVSQERFGQIFITDCNKVRLVGILQKQQMRLYAVQCCRRQYSSRTDQRHRNCSLTHREQTSSNKFLYSDLAP